MCAAGTFIGLSPMPPKISYENISIYGLNPPDISNVYPNLKITLYKYNTITKAFIPTLSNEKIAGNSKGSGSFKNLNSGAYYCLKFDGGNINFHGFVGGK